MTTIEDCRKLWEDIAMKQGWYKEPFHVMVWVTEDGKVVDSVSYEDLDADIVETVTADDYDLEAYA